MSAIAIAQAEQKKEILRGDENVMIVGENTIKFEHWPAGDNASLVRAAVGGEPVVVEDTNGLYVVANVCILMARDENTPYCNEFANVLVRKLVGPPYWVLCGPVVFWFRGKSFEVKRNKHVAREVYDAHCASLSPETSVV